MGELLTFRPRAAAETVASAPDACRPSSEAALKPTPTTAALVTSVASPRSELEPLWREVTGRALRDARHRRKETLAGIAARAGVSTPYLSEIERGRKEPSSEVLAAVAGALDLTLAELTLATLRLLMPLELAAERRPGPPARPSGPIALAG